MPQSTPTTLRELDSRTFDGIHVRMLWSELDDRVVVAVWDSKTAESLLVVVGDDDRPADVFAHPYAYAAWRGVTPHRHATDAEQLAALPS